MDKGFSPGEVGHDNEGFTKDSLRDNVQINETGEDRSRAEQSKLTASTAEKGNAKDDADLSDEVDLSCGIWKFRTNVFGAKFSNLYVFITCVGLSTFFTIIVQSTFQVQLVSMQRQFRINNAQTGLFETASRIGSLSTILFAGHFAKSAHIPVVVGLAGVIQGLIFMVPAFIQIFDPYTLPVLSTGDQNLNDTNSTSENDKYLCNALDTIVNGSVVDITFPTPPSDDNTNKFAFNVLIIMQAIKGITDAFHAGFLPTLYIDDNALDKTKMGFLFGIQNVISTLAYPVGKQINAFLSTVPIDLKPTKMNDQDERFVAAWWLPFLVFGALTILFSLPIMLFPRKLVSQRQQVESLKKALVTFGDDDDKAAATGTTDNKDKDLKTENPRTVTKEDDSPIATRRNSHFSQAPRMSITSGVLDTASHINKRASLVPPLQGPSERKISIGGKLIFQQPIRKTESVDGKESTQGSSNIFDLIKDFPKAIYRVFRRPVFTVFVIDVFIQSIPISGLAMFRTVYVTTEYNVSMADAATLTSVTQIVGQLLGTFIGMYLSHKVNSKMGYVYILLVTHAIPLISTPFYLMLTCDNEPVYGHDGDYGVYTNTSDTCGCKGVGQLLSCGLDGNNYLSPCYAGCKSFSDEVFTMCSGLGGHNQTMTLKPGVCTTPCRPNYIMYAVLHAVQIMMWLLSSIPDQLLCLRMVDPRDRGFATSFFAFANTISSIPAPNIFGRVIDGTCLIWNGNVCSLYDRDKIRYLLSGADIGVNVIVQITFFLTYYFFKKEADEMKKNQEIQNGKKEDVAITTQL